VRLGAGAADSGSGATAIAQNAPNEATAKALESDILAPRFYTTNFEKFDKMILDSQKKELEKILAEFKQDNNRGHFVRTEEFKGPFPDLPSQEFEDFLRRSCLGEFSGCLLYQEISKRTSNPILKDAFKYMTRDEGRHASFLTHTMKDLGIKFDLGFLAEAKQRVKIPPKIMFYTVYLSEIIGYYRYITIFDHLEANPEKRFHPIFRWFGRWCEDEHRHGHFFAALMRSQDKQCLQGPLNYLLIKFFTLSVYMTMFLRDAAPGAASLYRAMGFDPREYDLHVIKRCDEEASTVWGFRFQVDHPDFVKQLDKMAVNNEKLRKFKGKSGFFAKLGQMTLKANNIYRIGRLFFMPAIKTR
jgi:magnesium-protoporphyrin IX monomethyl ester (oxidative) cyclase